MTTGGTVSSDMTLVAPREIDDYVRWAARVCGCGPGLVGRMATSVTFAEIHYGGALAVFVDELDGGLAASDFAVAPADVVAAEIAARSRGTGRIEFDAPVRFAAVAWTLDDASTRGVVCTDLPRVVSSPTELTGVTLSTRSATDGSPGPTRLYRPETATAAFQRGIAVDTLVWDRISDVAKQFRVSEHELDAAEA